MSASNARVLSSGLELEVPTIVDNRVTGNLSFPITSFDPQTSNGQIEKEPLINAD
jgi:hypothetical protein